MQEKNYLRSLKKMDIGIFQKIYMKNMVLGEQILEKGVIQKRLKLVQIS